MVRVQSLVWELITHLKPRRQRKKEKKKDGDTSHFLEWTSGSEEIMKRKMLRKHFPS